ncbi:MAG: InlB B-repeat-containing protein [Paludibacteraceae bacterium]|nr:InlB B-repeat-containing protein [Paludibacteraceae bacterium]
MTSYSDKAAAAGNHVSGHFTVASGYSFTPLRVSLATTAISNAKNMSVMMGSDTVVWRQPASSSATPTRHEYSFSSPSSYTGKDSLKFVAYGETSGFRIGSPITVYGILEATGYTISFAGNGNTDGSTASVTSITSGSDVSQITANGFTKNGYSFAGWKTNTALTYVPYGKEDTEGNRVAVAVNGSVPDKAKIKNVTSDITLTAQWTEDTHTVSVAAGAHGTVSPSSVSGVGIATASGNITATPATGYSFNGWILPSGVTAAAGKTASSNPIQINATADGKTITATWTTVSYTITYNLNSGLLDGSQKTSYNIETEDYDLPTPTRDDYVFQGWYTDDEFTSDRVYTLAEGSTGDKTYYAKWADDLTINWTITKVSSKLYKGGTGYTVTAEIDDASWDASGDKDDLVLSASDGVTLSNITKSINGSDKAQVEANFSIAGDVDGDKIYFTLSVPAAGDYSAIEDEKEVDLDDCPGGSAYVIPVQSSASDPDGAGGMSYAWISDNGYITRGFGLSSTGVSADEYTGISSYRSNSGASGWMFKTVHGGSTIRIYLKGTQNAGTTISSVYYKTSYFSETSSATSLTPTSTAYYTSAGVSCDNIANGVAGYAELSFSSALADNSFVYFTTSNNTHTYGVSVVGSGGSGGVETSLAWSSSLADKATVNKDDVDPDFQYYASPTPSNAGGPISYTSSDESVATVSSNGTVHIVGDGSTTITAAMPAYGCYSAATSITYSLVVANTCADTPGTIVDNDGNAIAGNKVSRGACETLTLKLTGHTGSTIAWKKDGVTIVGATNASYTIPAGNSYSGVYSATVTGACTLSSTNSITVTTAGSVDPTIFADEFTVKSGRPFHYRLMQLNKGESVSVKSTTSWTENTDFVITKDADNIVYISSKTYAGVTIASAGTETITLTISNECGDPTDKAITIHKIVATAKPTVAWIATGDTKGEKTCKASESTNTTLYEYLEDYYTMTAINCYWSTSEADLVEEYSKYDLIILTDYPNSGTCPKGKSGKANSYTNAIGLLIDHRPILTFEAFVAGCPNWGIASNPTNTKTTQTDLTLLCNAGDIFDDDSGTFAAGEDIAVTTASSGQALQGFPVASSPDFVFIGKITDSDDKEYVACCERQVQTEARMMVFGLNSAIMSNMTDDGKIMVQKFVDYLLIMNAASIPDCSVIFNGGGADNSWYTTGNWESGSLPDAYASVRIDKPCEVPYSTNPAKAGSIKIHQGGAFTGSLTIQPRGRMIVEKTITRIEGDEYTVHKPTEVSDLVLETSEDGNGVLIMGSYDGTNKATVGFYTKAKKTGGHNVNQFIGTPFNDETYVFNNYYGTKIYEFRAAHDGDKGTDNEWIRLPNDGDMRPFYGYNILTNQADERTLWMEGTLVASEDQKMKMYYNGSSNTENMFANSWPAPIDIAQFTASDFGGGVATVYIFNAGTVENYTAMASGSASATSAGQFIVLPIASAPWTSPTVRVIPSMQAFSVFASGSNQTMTLDYDRLVRTRAASMDKDSLTTATRAPRRAAEEPVVMHLRVDGINGYAANMHMLEREDLTDGFDNGWDGHHMVGDEDAPQLYAITEAGKMNVNCVPNMEGTVLGFRAGTDNQFTFSFGYEGEEDWYLNDLKEQKSTLIDDMSSYTFMVEPEDTEARFVISKTPIRQTPTGCESVGGAESAKVRKLIINDKIYIIRGGRMYSVDGQMVK